MVYMKKGSTPKKQQQIKKGKKAAPVKQEDDDIDIDDMDDSDSSDDTPQLQKTPLNKSTKGRQSLSEKKVSFSIPGKNSPSVKTPKKDNSILSKKQLTPANKGKTSMPEFIEIKKKKNQTQEEEDDEDDDFEMDEDMDDDDLDLEIDEDDEDDDDEDGDEKEEEDDEEEDSDEDGEEEVDIQKKLSMLKQNNGQQKKTPLKGNDKAKSAGSPTKGQTPKNEQPGKAIPKTKEVLDEVERRRQRDSKMLYIGGLPTDVTSEELKALSDDIIDVTLPYAGRKHPSKTLFAFVAFNTEAKAESAYKALQSKKFRGQPLSLDFVGAKSNNRKVAEETNMKLNLKKLHISGIPLECTIDQVAKYFKAAYQISFNMAPLFRSAMINFDNEEAAKEAYTANKEIVLCGHKLTVLYSKQGPSQGKKRKSKGKGHKNSLSHGFLQRHQGGNPSKKMKFSKQGVKSEE